MIRTYFDLAARGKNAWWRYALVPVAGMAFAVLFFVLVSFALSAAHFNPRALAARITQPSDPAGFFTGAAVLYGAFAGAFALAIFLLHRKRPGDLIGRFSFALFLAGAGLWLLVQLAITGIDYVLAPKGFSLTLAPATASLAAFAATGLAIQTFAEEFVFRGWLTQGLLLATKHPLSASIISGILFGALHIPNGLPQAVSATMFGICCSLIAIRTGGIAFTFGLHLVNNYFGAVFVVSAGDVFRGSPSILSQNTPSLMWSDVALTALALLFVTLTTRANSSLKSPERLRSNVS